MKHSIKRNAFPQKLMYAHKCRSTGSENSGYHNKSRQPGGQGDHEADEASKDSLTIIKTNEKQYKRSSSGPEKELGVSVCKEVDIM